jgi:hypothetical protein
MPSIILDDFLNDIKIELQLAHKSSVDDKNLVMIHKVFGEIKKLKKERDFFECEFHKTLEHQADDCEQYENQIENLKKEDPIQDCMNDIINQVEARGWRDLNGHRDRLLKKYTKQTKVIEEMKDDWAVATEKIGQENSDLHNEIKRLKKMLQKRKILPKGWVMVELEGSQKVARDLMKADEELCNLRKELKAYKSDAINQGQININREKEIKLLKEENEKLKKDNWSLKLEVKSAQEVTMAYMKRFDKLAEIKVERACSRIQCEDKFGHLIGRIPTDK